jgi:serine/threonine-protein kinase
VKACTSCQRLYPDDGGFCPVDGQRLAPVAEVPIPTDPEDPRVGRVFCGGRYQIRRRVADGGMGRVYQALDLRENRSVALKILHPEVATDPVSVARFKREFEVSASLPHEHIVEVLAFEQTEDDSFTVVMEYLEGEELRMLLKREKILSPERLLRMMAQVAIGLTAAHERKIIHRDLKPDNVFLCGTREGDIVKILDFGSVRDNSEGAKKLTVMGTTIGSPFYMSPEQAQGLPSLDHRADVWSLAAIAYECLTGTVPFAGPTGPAILLSILTKDPTPPSVAGSAHGVPKTLDDVMEEALAKDAAIRIPTIGALVDRFGAAFGLEGDHHAWAREPQDQLGARIRASLPAALEKHAQAGALDTSGLDDAFKAGSQGGPVNPFYDDQMVMGVPDARPRWLIPAVAGAAVLVGAVVALLFAR